MTDHGRHDIDQVLKKYLPSSSVAEQATDEPAPAPEGEPEPDEQPDQQPETEDPPNPAGNNGPDGVLAWLKANLLFISLAVLTVWGLIATFTG